MSDEFSTEARVKLYLKDDGGSTPVLRFPMGRYSGNLPSLVLVRSVDTGRALLTGTALWGNPNMPDDADAVRVGPSVLRALERPGEPGKSRYHPALVRRARLRDVAVHQRGLGVSLLLATLVMLAAVAAAVAAFITSGAPFGLALAALVLASLAAIATAAKSVRDKVSAR